MPELPEVEVTRRGLLPHISGRVISGVEIREPRLRWPLPPAVHPERLHALTRAHRTPIKLFLMDSRRIAGVGNIYANESLFRAGIHPRTPARRLSRGRCALLAAAIKETLRAAIRAGGSSLRDFVGADGNPGYFQRRYWVYERAGQPCRRCGSAIRRIAQGQRSTFFCPRCQR